MRSAAGREPSSGTTAGATLRRSSAFADGSRAPFAFATASSRRMRSLMAHALGSAAAALATALSAGVSAALFVEATASSSNLAGGSAARPGLSASACVACARCSDAEPRSAIARMAPARVSTPAPAASACMRLATSSTRAPAVPTTRSTCSCSSGDGGGTRPSSVSSARAAKALATSTHPAGPASRTASRASEGFISATRRAQGATSAASCRAAPGSLSTRASSAASRAHLPSCNCRNTTPAAASSAACRKPRRSEPGVAPPTVLTTSIRSSVSFSGRRTSPPAVATERMDAKLPSTLFWAEIRSIVLWMSAVSSSVRGAANTASARAAAGSGKLLSSFSLALAMIEAIASALAVEYSNLASFSCGVRSRTHRASLQYSQASQWPSKYVTKSSSSHSGFWRIWAK
mmetsp:Transcript_836/g.2170  ORF Transcript_836/g.2170 Transcript_836/m.2170 type:complete len:405 (-) Transcript_836:659-1873(-)